MLCNLILKILPWSLNIFPEVEHENIFVDASILVSQLKVQHILKPYFNIFVF